jgi:hypothetical protein
MLGWLAVLQAYEHTPVLIQQQRGKIFVLLDVQKNAVIIQDMERPSRLSFRPEETRSVEADVETGLLKLDVPNEALKQD